MQSCSIFDALIESELGYLWSDDFVSEFRIIRYKMEVFIHIVLDE